MTTTIAEDPTAPANATTAQLIEVRRVMVASLASRGFPPADIDDVVQDVLVKIVVRHPGRFTDKLADLDRHGAYFAKAALNAYRMRLRSESRRRRRQELNWESSTGAEQSDVARDAVDGNDVLALSRSAPLTTRQRQYLNYVFVDRLSIEEIAARTHTTPRAVRALLQRAGEILRQSHSGVAA